MDTIDLSSNEPQVNINDKNLEIFHLLWLDSNVNIKGTRDTEQKLRSIINHLKKFQDTQQFQQYIQQTSKKDRLVIIVSGQLGQEIVPSIHQLRQVISIYVYCMDKKKNELWACSFPKVKAVIVELNELISRIKADYKIQQKVEEPLSINIFTTRSGTGKSTTGVNGEFVFSQVLIDCLLRLKSTETDKNELIDYYKNEYEENDIELNNLQEFQKGYSPDKVLWWYTRESFFYKTLNAALRTQNIHMMFLFRAFMYDIHHQLYIHRAKHSLQVYRSQMMSTDEVENLKRNIGQFISVNSFFSTSTERETALFLLGDTNSLFDLERVLFEIEADPKLITTKSFANISKLSAFPNESEVLFMIGSIFRLESIHFNDDRIWIIRMTFCSDDEHDLKQVLMYMKQQNGSGFTNLRRLGKILWKMGKLDLAKKYFKRLLKRLPPNDSLLGTLFEDLGELAALRGDYDKSMEWHRKSLAIKIQNPSTIDFHFINIDNTIGQEFISSSSLSQINIRTKWKQHGITIAGGNGPGNGLNQLCYPYSMYLDEDNKKIYIADFGNNRVVEWKFGAKNGQIVAGGNGRGSKMDQLSDPRDIVVDEENDCFIICDSQNKRAVRWSRRNGGIGETIIPDIHCTRLAMDDNGDLYVSDYSKSEVRRWKRGERNGTVVAGGNGEGNKLNQLNRPTDMFIDKDHSVYVSDCENHRVMKWRKGATEGIIVAGGLGRGNGLAQLSYPEGLFVDMQDNVYVVDSINDRVMFWSKGFKQGDIIIGGNGKGDEANQLSSPRGLFSDREGNLYVVDKENHRVQKFLIDFN